MQDLVRTLVQAHGALDDLNLFKPHEVLLRWHPSEPGNAPDDLIRLEKGSRPDRTFDRIMVEIECEPGTRYVRYLLLLGHGVARDPHGRPIIIDGLFELKGFWHADSVHIELTAHHDVWFPYAFDGSPHPRIYRHNALRLTAGIQAIGAALDAEVEPGDATFFCEPGPEGILPPDDDEIIDGLYFDVTPMRGPWWTFQETPLAD